MKTILLTGATDGIGFETAKQLVELGHHVVLHGRNADKLACVEQELAALNPDANVETVVSDLSNLAAVRDMVAEIAQRFGRIDILINNAGVFTTNQTVTPEGLDVRFVVNTIAPYLLTKELLPLLCTNARVVNLSSAAQASVDVDALLGKKTLGDNPAYAQSKLALTMWSRMLGLENRAHGPMIVSVNPKSFLGSKMVKKAYGVAGGDIRLGAHILVKAALSEEFENAHGAYYDNDIEAFAQPHADALDDGKVMKVIAAIDSLLA
ncbi:SDR family NAD(P)-dependent oxidoreductase [Vibrio sp. LaRot3]|uniref:SDR family NAD(P)-dependent oxidoreductase n=1 Tax=Vibrio sp. LaRot3 TaxID=2998829 RepID=UPI0022CDC807|nr:SDR family NAD(P)-dependent oxidoreductase [Vibrio sp. LaRot3]MDA0148237.1 SDR family NAD(P)-dependent oxidoreductase [Vibrio sp. LaRot3]